ncbi:unnamed protein product [Zymoseptoria tritici ST99CH_1A5]|uniref:Urease accessory protein UreD n=4 Tax=Zymoseptoria tritici TaxID=1047171 RepID=F9X418_ZYMTI|nr:uncharacterized protein MYCGRDRAFT_36159 [Zymoseptoria tritici IPO323]SMQ48152.1 unnamed protein product [Zymoseptoria tritici ST99CH_3D7]SMR46702.1 unnamed protein product [Zymoseptoria tritici ST99CH_1E4]SMR47941.1 unnamed protein product [Zymoseptoria tritici ST99CH_3D1]SMY21847.1 unnamed protein product [Zymoseptoria tritici ST99CH_1A5]EGP90148.1 hypothetical protein MYCGRDRAFT_36159 [Zymoseptoria tritici IPO323]
MPHKHTRRNDGDQKNFNLPPTILAKPLPNYEKTEKTSLKRGQRKAPQKEHQPNLKRKRQNGGGTTDYGADDTPRAFARLMDLSAGKKMRSGLDNGESKKAVKKKRKLEDDTAKAAAGGKSTPAKETEAAAAAAALLTAPPPAQLKIQPGERLADFAARVNQTLPMSGLTRKGGAGQERVTKTEKRMKKMYAEWRTEEQKRKDKLEELQEQQEDEDEELATEHGGQQVRLSTVGRKGKRARMVGEVSDDEDPWAVLKERRDKPKGLHDVVLAPPTIKVVPKERFKVRDGAKVEVANVPGASGSLKRREELGEARMEVIERYRAMMKAAKT